MMAEMKLSAAYFLLAQKLQESASAMCHEDIRTRLQDALRDSFSGTGNWCYIVAVFGDDKSGDVVYSCNSDLKKAAYSMAPGKTTVAIDTAVDVQPLTTYEVESVGVSEAGRRNSARDQRQLQAIHDGAKGLGALCVAAKEAARPAPIAVAPGTAVSTGDTLSTREALVSGNPQAVRDILTCAGIPETKLASVLESLGIRKTAQNDSIQLLEGVATSEVIRVAESAKSDYEIKLIAPGKGSSAFYPAEVLKRDGPKVFKEGTHVYLNHPTLAEEAARPEGDVANLAGVLSSGAVYYESHAKGPGLYGRMKVFADHAQTVEEKAAHVGMSIRAAGIAEAGRMQDGVPVLKELTAAESVDIVTRAGAGGMILTESAIMPKTTQGADDMDAAELKKLNETIAAQNVVNARLLERALRADAREAAVKILAGITLAEVCKARVVEAVTAGALPKTEAGELDAVKFAELVNQEAKREGEYVAALTGSGEVTGMGGGPSLVETDPVKAREAAERRKAETADEMAESVRVFEAMGMDPKAAKFAAGGRAA